MSTFTIHTKTKAQQTALLDFIQREQLIFEAVRTTARRNEAKLLAEVKEKRRRIFGSKSIDHLRVDTTRWKFNREEANER